MYWVALERGLAFKAELEFRDVVIPDDPVKAAQALNRGTGLEADRVEGLGDGNFPCTYPSGRRLYMMTAGEPTVSIGVSADQFLASIESGLRYADPSCLDDPRIETALSLFCSRQYESSENAKLLVLVMALESMTDRRPKAQIALDLLDRWQLEVASCRRDQEAGGADVEALESLERELLFRRDASLRSSVRALVFETLSGAGVEDAPDIARRAVRVYDARSKLAHEGRLPKDELSRAVSEAEAVVAAVLTAKVQRA